jgi:hypothetical protein
MKLRTLVLGIGIGSLLVGGLTFGASWASAAGGNPTYYACLKAGTLTHVGGIPPNCKAPATAISFGANGSNVIVSPSTPYGSCNSGDTDIALSTDEVWSCLAGNWTDTGSSIKGPAGGQGPSGPQGSQGPPGATGAQGPMGPAGGVSVYTWSDGNGDGDGNSVQGSTLLPAGSTITLDSGSLSGFFDGCVAAPGDPLVVPFSVQFYDVADGTAIATWTEKGNAGNVSDDVPGSTTTVTLSTQTPLGFRATCEGDELGGLSYTFNVSFTVTAPPTIYS